MRILGIIPARGGSKGVPRKNIIDIQGKPLIAYSIEPALKAKNKGIIDELIVSTDDEEIAEISRNLGVEVPFLRPVELSGDKSKSVDLMIHAYNFYSDMNVVYDAVLLLQPTSPLRTADDIDEAVHIFKSTGATSLISCYREESIHEFGLYHKSGDWAVALNKEHNLGTRRQDMPELFVRNGAIYLVRTDYMLCEHNVFDEKPAMYVMPKERSINIDTMKEIVEVRSILEVNK